MEDAYSEVVSRNNTVYSIEDVVHYLESPILKDWQSNLDPKMIHSIGKYTDSRYIVGYKPASIDNLDGENVSLIDMTSTLWQNARSSLIGDILQSDPSAEIINHRLASKLPFFRLSSSSYSTMIDIINHENFYFIEPNAEVFLEMADAGGYSTNRIRNDIGCDVCDGGNVSEDSYVLLDPNNIKQSWHHEFQMISDTEAWSESTGSGIGVVIIDTGVSEDQENLDNDQDFNSGWSTGRTETRENFLPALIDEAHVWLGVSPIPGDGPGAWVAVPFES